MKKSVDRLANKITGLSHNSHICAFYKSPQERLDYLSAYYKVGIQRGEMCVFVSNQDAKVFISKLKDNGLNIEPFVKKGMFQIFSDEKTYLPNGKFEASGMLDNLRGFTDKALYKKLPGVRGGGDMTWIESMDEAWEEVGEYESKINRFIRSDCFTGICMFPEKMLHSSNLAQRIIQSHQYMIRNGDLIKNPYYSPPEKSYRFDIKIVAEMEKWLDSMDSKEAARASA